MLSNLFRGPQSSRKRSQLRRRRAARRMFFGGANSFTLQCEPLEARVLLAVDIAATKIDSLFTDVDSDNVADPGDTLQYDVTITNNGNMDATGVAFNDTEDGNTTLVGSVKITPIAFDDGPYMLTGNTPITINAASGVLLNDIDPDSSPTPLMNTGVTAVGLDVTGTQGTVSLNTDGSFTFTPTTGFTGLTTFKYTARDADSLDSVVTGTVTMNVSGLVWYVDSAYADGGNDGSFNKPFTSLTPLSGAGGAGDPDATGNTIFVYESGATYTGGIELENTQSLIGKSIGLTVNGMTIGGSGSNPTIATAAAANDITLASGNTVRGFTLGNSSGSALAGTSFGTLTIDTVAINTNGQALNLNTGAFGVGAAFTSITATGGSTGINLVTIAGSVDLGSGALSGHIAPFLVNGGTVSTTYSGSITQPLNGTVVGVSFHSTGTITFQTGTLSATNGTGLFFNNATGTYNFNGTTTLNGGDAGIDILNVSSGTFSFSSNTSIGTTTSPSGPAFRMQNSDANVTYSGSINQDA
ncbi:MAG: Ig-like domain-containing protein [Planctomycetota bacterium]